MTRGVNFCPLDDSMFIWTFFCIFVSCNIMKGNLLCKKSSAPFKPCTFRVANCIMGSQKQKKKLYVWVKKVTADMIMLTRPCQRPKTVWVISPGKYQNFRNSLGNISNSKFLSGWLKLPICTRKIEDPNLFHRGLIL